MQLNGGQASQAGETSTHSAGSTMRPPAGAPYTGRALRGSTMRTVDDRGTYGPSLNGTDHPHRRRYRHRTENRLRRLIAKREAAIPLQRHL
ncbi:hypothetical protein KM043_017476 [Ampulex compressa]|nr:hypothetical protein KM043_017476 [Ampulex compressa]